MPTDATASQIMDAFATYEMAEMSDILNRAYGATKCITASGQVLKGGYPDALSGTLPCALGWLGPTGSVQPETEGGSLGNGTFKGQYIVVRWYAVAHDDDPGYQIAIKQMPFIERPIKAIVKHYTLGGIVARLELVPGWKLSSYQIGDDVHVGVEHTWRVTTYADYPVSA